MKKVQSMALVKSQILDRKVSLQHLMVEHTIHISLRDPHLKIRTVRTSCRNQYPNHPNSSLNLSPRSNLPRSSPILNQFSLRPRFPKPPKFRIGTTLTLEPRSKMRKSQPNLCRLPARKRRSKSLKRKRLALIPTIWRVKAPVDKS